MKNQRNSLICLLLALAMMVPVFAFAKAAETSNLEPLEISIGFLDAGAWGDDAIYDYLCKKFNITIKPITLAFGSENDVLNVAAASNNLPDMFYHQGWSSTAARPTFLKWAREGIIKVIPDEMIKNTAHLSTIMTNFDSFRVDGSHYLLPRIIFSDPNNYFCATSTIWLRKDWIQELNLGRPSTLDELYTVFQGLATKASSGYAITAGDTMYWVFDAYQVNPEEWSYEDGQWVPNMLVDRNVLALKYLRKLYVEHLLDPDFFTIKREDGMDRFVSGRVGAISYISEAWHFKENIADKMQKVNPDWGMNVIEILGPVGSETGDPITYNHYNNWSGTLFGANITDAKLERCIALYDYLLSDEGLALCRLGIEGVHYKMEGDKVVSLMPIDKNTGLPMQLTLLCPTAGIKSLVSWDNDGKWIEPSMPKACIEAEKYAKTLVSPYLSQVSPLIRQYSSEAKDKMNISDPFYEMVSRCVLQNVDIDAEFAKYKQQMLEDENAAQAIIDVTEYAKAAKFQP